MTQQIETAVVLGTVTGTGNASVTVTAFGMTNSPKTISVAVTSSDTASIVGGLIRTALAFDANVAALFLVSGSGANVILTKHLSAANDTTLNIAIDNGTCTGLTAAPTSTNTTAGDGLTNAYCAITDVRNDDILKLSTGTSHDDLLTKNINAVSRLIDLSTGRRFYTTIDARYFTATDPYCVKVGDIGSVSGVTIETDLNADGVFEYTWSSTDYNLAPYNALLEDLAFTQIEKAPLGSNIFPTSRRGVKVTAAFGFAAVPPIIQQACVLQVNRIWAKYKAPQGVAGATAIGTITYQTPKLDPDIEMMISKYRLLT